ncbi:hypothetical protein [Cellulomonas sp. Root137]|uniref:hypothetical protein n=1 Tax=Cellulomonas sp. Root137 TaxID=1736459 RepID=UPI0012E3E3CB|nr:hypothetical protein [Cellulomonas sp. Root137]
MSRLEVLRIRHNSRLLVRFLREHGIDAVAVEDDDVAMIRTAWSPLDHSLTRPDLDALTVLDSEIEGGGLGRAMEWLAGYPAMTWNVVSVPEREIGKGSGVEGLVHVDREDRDRVVTLCVGRWRWVTCYRSDGAARLMIADDPPDPIWAAARVLRGSDS